MRKILAFLIGTLQLSSFLNAQSFGDFSISNFRWHAGLNSSYMKNSSLSDFMSTYSKNNGKESKGNIKIMNGFEAGMKWNILTMSVIKNTAGVSYDLGSNLTRQFRMNNTYVNVLGTFSVKKNKTWLSIGLSSISSRFIAQVKYPNGEKSRTMEFNLNGTYKGTALNGVLRVDHKLSKKDKKYWTVYAQFIGPIEGTSRDYGDFNAGKGALNTGNNSIVNLKIKSTFTGFIFGFNYNIERGGKLK